MGKMLLILIVGIGGIFTFYDLANLQSDFRVINDVILDYEKTQARNLAASGIEIATKELSLNPNWNESNIQLDEGKLNISATSTTSMYPGGPDMSLSDHLEIISTGTVNGISVVVKSVVEVPSGSGGNPPEFLNYALLSGGNATMNGNVHVTDDGNSSWNSDFHTNGNLQINGNNSFSGFGTYSGNAHSNPPKNLDRTFNPNNNPSGGITQFQTPPVDIPTFNASDYAAKATNTAVGNLIINSNQTLGTEENPVIYYVQGDLILKANMSGYGVFIVTGNVICQGNVTISSPDSEQNNLGIYANGDINLHGNTSVSAQLLSKSNINFGGNSTLHGLATARGLFNFNGNVDIKYKPSGVSLTDPFWESGGGVSRAIVKSYYE